MGDEGPIWHFQPHFFAIGGFRIHHWGNSTRIHGKPSGGKPFRNEDFLKDGIGRCFSSGLMILFFDQQYPLSFVSFINHGMTRYYNIVNIYIYILNILVHDDGYISPIYCYILYIL
jgi:hypothetical protein